MSLSVILREAILSVPFGSDRRTGCEACCKAVEKAREGGADPELCEIVRLLVCVAAGVRP